MNRILGVLLWISLPLYLASTIPVMICILFFILIIDGYSEAKNNFHMAIKVLICDHFHGITKMVTKGYSIFWWHK